MSLLRIDPMHALCPRFDPDELVHAIDLQRSNHYVNMSMFSYPGK